MPPLPARPEKEKRIKSIMAFATDLESQLPAAAVSKGTTPLSQEIEKQIYGFPSIFAPSAAPRCDEIDAIGTTIWNHCTRLRREYDSDNPQDVPAVLLFARVFAFLLLDCAYQTGKSESSNVLRLMKTGIKAAKSCLEKKVDSLALKVLEKVAGFEALLKKPEQHTGQTFEEGERLIAEYYVLRTALAWRQDNLTVAELMFKKSTVSSKCFDAHTSESLADVLYEMGKDLFSKQQNQIAVKWLERAYQILEGQELDKLSMDACELRISIIQMLVKALLAAKTSETTDRAQDLIKLLEGEIGDKLIVLLLKIESLANPEGDILDINTYNNILQRMVRTVSLNDNNFRLIMFHVRKISEKGPGQACNILEELWTLRLVDEDNEDWIEKVIITRLWILVSHKDVNEALQAFDMTLPSMASNLKRPLRPSAAHAAHMLLWKRIEATYTQGHYNVAEKWCKLALHQLFSTSGELNIGRISRKLLLCALAKQDLGAAKDIFQTMSANVQNDPITQFLMYRIAICGNDVDLASKCLAFISSSSTEDLSLMYACCLDAQKSGDKGQTLNTLQLVLDNHSQKSTMLHLPSLVRLTIGLMESVIEEHAKAGRTGEAHSMAEKMCAAFEKASAALQKSRSHGKVSDTVWSLDELDWFSKNSYNIAIKHLSSWHPRLTVRMLVCCIAFIDCYPKDLGEHVYEDVTLRKMFCEFSAATALVSLARGEDNIEARLQDYLTLRKHVEIFDTLLQAKLEEKMDDDADQDLRRKLSILAAFDFEAACQLKAWDSLLEAIVKAEQCKNCQVYEVMADCLLSSEAPSLVIVNTLKTIVNEVWSLNADIHKLAKYMRCLFQIALAEDKDVAEQLLNQISSGAERSAETEFPYPDEELEWVATKAFNHAIDLYCASDDERCRIWAAQALKVAHYCNDDGILEKIFHSKLAGLHLGSVDD